jgi:hypothetical protein
VCRDRGRVVVELCALKLFYDLLRTYQKLRKKLAKKTINNSLLKKLDQHQKGFCLLQGLVTDSYSISTDASYSDPPIVTWEFGAVFRPHRRVPKVSG